ncbi:hypothetical protein XavaCFBP5823_03140 [Xanthomonas axonopodis pv. vasculorum]|nr:hypothetical protein XavaCFBP5823_03140 [Xanthomonas axonopodis pv. vasculorum]
MPCSQPCIPTLSSGPCPPTVARPDAASTPRKSYRGHTCSVSRDSKLRVHGGLNCQPGRVLRATPTQAASDWRCAVVLLVALSPSHH